MTLSDFSSYEDLVGISLLIASLGMAGVTIPASITAFRSNTRRSKLLVYVCLLMALSFIACNLDWQTGSLINIARQSGSIQNNLWSLLPFFLANGYLIEFARCRKCLNLSRRSSDKIKVTEIK